MICHHETEFFSSYEDLKDLETECFPTYDDLKDLE
jgi:hypothetical protein